MVCGKLDSLTMNHYKLLGAKQIALVCEAHDAVKPPSQHARGINITGDLWPTLLYFFSKSGVYWIYGVQVTPSLRRCPRKVHFYSAGAGSGTYRTDPEGLVSLAYTLHRPMV